MQNYEVIPEFVDIFADVHSKITKRDKANRSIPQQQSTTVNQNNKKVRKVLKILLERLVLEKTVKELSAKYGVRDSKICKILRGSPVIHLVYVMITKVRNIQPDASCKAIISNILSTYLITRNHKN